MEQNEKIQQMQLLEQNMQNLLLQKQAFQMELSETKKSIEEIENAGDEVYKIIGQMMIKSDKKKMKEELSNKEKILEMRVNSIEKQEEEFNSQIEELRKGFIEKK